LGKLIENAHFLDLFAGSGLIGLEALSRGAGYLTVVEKTGICVDTIKANALRLGYEKKTKIIHTDFRKAINSLNADQFNIIFADPPYMSDHCKLVTKLVAEKQLLKVNGLLIVEHSKDISVEPEGRELRLIECRPYGQSAFSFFVRREPPKEIVPTVKPIEVKEEPKKALPPREFKERPSGEFKGRREFKEKREFRKHKGSEDPERRGTKKFKGPRKPPKPGT
jgi:16S rRNA (guanine(966)-N(2))-methyltransferase RsmD